MDILRAKQVLEILADGVDPTTGEVLPDTDSSNNPEVVRALHAAIAELDRSIRKNKRSQPENYGKPWTEQDDKLLSGMYDKGATIPELSKYFKRTRGSITARLERLGIIPGRFGHK